MLKLCYMIIMIQQIVTSAAQDASLTDNQSAFSEDIYMQSLKMLMDNEEIGMKRCFIYDPGNWVRFMLYTRGELQFEELFLGDLGSIEQSNFNKSRETKIVVHGWLSKGYMRFSRDIRQAFLKSRDCNVISIDWPSMTLYSIARLSVGSVAAKLSEFLDFLINVVGVEIDTIHLLGHSLGAHIAGIAGSSLENVTLPRITGFDPAGPLFSRNPEYRIDASDAEFVDIIHTSRLGYYDPIGHVDFYPNGGTSIQPGCGFDFELYLPGYCSHCRSYSFYVETILSKEPKYLAAKCDSYTNFKDGKCCTDISEMGDNVDREARGKYFLFTGDHLPYGLGIRSMPEKCLNESVHYIVQ